MKWKYDVALAQLFVQRVIGLRTGKLVFDGPPEDLNPEALTRIYGEEDWTQTTRERGGAREDEEGDAVVLPFETHAHHPAALDRDRLAGAR